MIDGALVQRIELQPSGSELVATAVHYEKDGRPQVIKASKEVILSAGESSGVVCWKPKGFPNLIIFMPRIVPNSENTRAIG